MLFGNVLCMWTGHHHVMALSWTPDKRQIMWGKDGESGGRIGVMGPSKNLCQGRGSLGGGEVWRPYVQQSAYLRGKVR